ncbi:gamma-glutamylcyclotransferase family protein [Aliamphritea spongicola]|nr:gamma-glutamylcyclotransferase family protein [Aliamphritea spongicola]
MQPHPLFIYGSLLDKDILSCVLGREIDPDMVCPARLADFATHTYPNESFPCSSPAPATLPPGKLYTD